MVILWQSTVQFNGKPKFYAPEEDFNLAKDWVEESYKTYQYGYYRLVEKVDQQIGEILDALKRGKHEENTLVVFSSDHGDMIRNFLSQQLQTIGGLHFTNKTTAHFHHRKVDLI